MIDRLKRILGKAQTYSIDPVTGNPKGYIRLSEAEEFGIARVGRHTAGGRHETPLIRVSGTEQSEITIGAFSMFGEGVTLLTGGRHPFSRVTCYPIKTQWGLHTKPYAERSMAERDTSPGRPLVIGNNVWVSAGATILDGVTIGDGAVIAANALVTRDVEPFTLVGGNPAKVIRKRFSDEQIAGLLEIKWWDWPDEMIRERVDDLYTEDIDLFLSKYLPRSTGSPAEEAQAPLRPTNSSR